MCVKIHVLAADPALAPHQEAIQVAATSAIERIGRQLPLTEVDVVIECNPVATVPELGIGGFSPGGHLMRVYLDPTHARFGTALQLHLSRTLAHEWHHCARWRGPGYGHSLGEALVSEGLADHFDLQIHPGADPYPWTRALDEAALRRTWESARTSLSDSGYDHAHWFFNTGADGPPYHAGYSLGFRLVQAFLDSNPNRRPTDLVAVPASRILEGYKS